MASASGAAGARERIYSNSGNVPLLELIETRTGCVLDVGCGAGDNARLLRRMHPQLSVTGITHSPLEAVAAAPHMDECLVADIECGVPGALAGREFDVLLFSHVLEHVRHPSAVLGEYLKLLRRGGQVLCAVPNILSWRMRVQFARGDFSYQPAGELDDSHLRFFTYRTAKEYLLSHAPELRVIRYEASGNVPLGYLRRRVLPRGWSSKLDKWGLGKWPNLFGTQVLLSASKSSLSGTLPLPERLEDHC